MLTSRPFFSFINGALPLAVSSGVFLFNMVNWLFPLSKLGNSVEEADGSSQTPVTKWSWTVLADDWNRIVSATKFWSLPNKDILVCSDDAENGVDAEIEWIKSFCPTILTWPFFWYPRGRFSLMSWYPRCWLSFSAILTKLLSYRGVIQLILMTTNRLSATSFSK